MSIDEATSPVNVYKIPGGYLETRKDEDGDETVVLYDRVMLREMTGHEEDVLANEQMTMTERLHRILGQCIVELTSSETGEKITDKKVLVKSIGKMLLSDIVVLLIRLRQVSVGDRISFQVRCPDTNCKTLQAKSFDLRNLEAIPMKGDPKKRLREYKTTRDNIIQWEMVDGAREASFNALHPKKKTKRDRATTALLMRVTTINGEPATIGNLKGLPLAERNEIRNQFDDEGGMDTTFDVVCSGCQMDFISDMEVTGTGFFNPSEISED